LEKGYRRHFEEMKAQLISDGYVIYEGILPVEAEGASCEAAVVLHN
jgi:hypothetical protein